MTLTSVIAGLVMAVVFSVTVWALRASGGGGFFREFQTIWAGPWGKQVVIDFYGLEVVLALWMLTHAAQAGTWLAAGVCLALMPALGATAAAAYWLIAVAGLG